ncbi:MAG: acyl carrier protein [Pirellulaceae bacterium]
MDTAASLKTTNESVDGWLIELIADYYNIDSSELSRGTNFVSDLGTDSLDSMEILMCIEEEYDINFGEDVELKETSTIGTVSDAVTDRLSSS